jgi:hypothetical protein
MAKHVIETLIDDTDGTPAAETVYFALDNRGYEIDLSDENIDKLHEAFAPYIEAGRRAGNSHKPTKPEPGGRPAIDREEAVAIREWVRTNGGHIGDRGRIPKKFVEAYRSDPKDTSIFLKDDDEQPEPVTVDAGDFATGSSF